MDRGGALPDRCVVCNADAGGHRLSRKLYWSPLAWKLGAIATPFVVMGVGIALQSPVLTLLFWPLVLILMIAHTFVRKAFPVEIGLCPWHRGQRLVLRLLSFACIAGVVGSIFLPGQHYQATLTLLLWSLGGIVVLALVQTFVGAQRIAVKRLDPDYAWLARTGKAFRAALPELPPAAAPD